MGCFDTLIKGKDAVQVKCWNRRLLNFRIDEKVPSLHTQLSFNRNGMELSNLDTYTICLPSYEEKKYAVIKEGKFFNLTNSFRLTLAPYIDKYGKEITVNEAKELYNNKW